MRIAKALGLMKALLLPLYSSPLFSSSTSTTTPLINIWYNNIYTSILIEFAGESLVKWVMPEEARNYKVLKVVRKQLPRFSFSALDEYKYDKDVLYSVEEPSVVLGVLVWVGHPNGWSIEGGVEITARAYWGEEGCVPIFRRYLHKHDFIHTNSSATEGWGYGYGGAWNTEDAELVRLVPWTILLEEEENLYYHRDAKIVGNPRHGSFPVEAWDVDIYLYLAQK